MMIQCDMAPATWRCEALQCCLKLISACKSVYAGTPCHPPRSSGKACDWPITLSIESTLSVDVVQVRTFASGRSKTSPHSYKLGKDHIFLAWFETGVMATWAPSLMNLLLSVCCNTLCHDAIVCLLHLCPCTKPNDVSLYRMP